MKYSFKELSFLDSKMAKSQQILTTNLQIHNNTSISKVIIPKLYKIHPLHPIP